MTDRRLHSLKLCLACLDASRLGAKPLACRIINTGSMHALVASPYKSAYNAAKHGIAGLTKTVGLELAQKGNITCNAICPGWVPTGSPRSCCSRKLNLLGACHCLWHCLPFA